jgi:hypothetical protein
MQAEIDAGSLEPDGVVVARGAYEPLSTISHSFVT